MAVKILITRSIDKDLVQAVNPLIVKLHTLAMAQPGYISGETLKCIDRPGEYIVISTWRSLEDWNRWHSSQERITLQSTIDSITGKETAYTVYVPFG
ncbi:MAG: antibiotic biosynthesis monooxygenase [Desulfobulbaceae bacterium]|uniref:Antibiotic biosynthesis monooxygenase n=1 Tax=Candidatus Desulfobia pelagia TaxID=2841692 RepID=A0A8J6TGL2_9BACT|nr:antibiotic biosynthesis monooxygenase [Candidatus Desulfobia pelagia]